MVSAATAVVKTAETKSYSTTNSISNVKPSVSFDNVISAALTAGTKDNSKQTNKVSNTDIKNAADKKENVQVENEDINKQSDSIKNKLEETAAEVKEKIKENFDVTDEQLEEAMAMLGLGMLDLLQPDSLKQLVAAVNGQNDMLSILLNEDLSSGLQDLLGFLGEQMKVLSDSLNISDEQLKGIVEAALNSQDESKKNVNMVDVPEEAEGNLKNTETVTNVIEEKLTLVNEQSKNNSGSMSKGHQSSMNKAGTQELQTVSNLAQEISNSFSEVLVSGDEAINAADIVKQVIDSVKISQTQQLQNIEVALNPENLGKITVNVTARDGIVTARLVAENEQVKQALESQMVTLKEKFENQGIKVDAVEVTVQSHSFEANENLKGNDSQEENAGKKSPGRLKLDSLDDLEESELSDEEVRARDSIKNGVSSVEYSA